MSNKDEQDEFFSDADFGISQQNFNNSADLSDISDEENIFDTGDFYESTDGGDFFTNSNTFSNEVQSTSSQIGTGSSTEITRPAEVKTNLGYKAVGIIVAGLLLVLAIAIFLVSNAVSSPKKASENDQAQAGAVIEENPSSESSADESKSAVTEASSAESTPISSTNGFIEVPSDTYIDYTTGVISTQGTVSNKVIYIKNNQLIYCVVVDLSLGASTVSVEYYCGYNVFKQVSQNNIVTVDYQQVSETCYSVCGLSKQD